MFRAEVYESVFSDAGLSAQFITADEPSGLIVGLETEVLQAADIDAVVATPRFARSAVLRRVV